MVNDHLERLYLVIAMLLVVADSANDAFLYALGLQTDKVEYFTYMALALGALGVTKLFSGHKIL
jgi:hypothetical protein